MDVTRLDPYKADDVRAAVDVRNAARAVDMPVLHPTAETSYGGWLRLGWDGEAPYAWLGRVGGAAVAVLHVEAGTYDNTHLAWSTSPSTLSTGGVGMARPFTISEPTTPGVNSDAPPSAWKAGITRRRGASPRRTVTSPGTSRHFVDRRSPR